MTNAFILYLSSLLVFLIISRGIYVSEAQAQPKAKAKAKAKASGEGDEPGALPPAAETCNGVYISYDFLSRRKEFPRVKNVTAQSWAFNATATVLNTGTEVLKSWKLFIGFQHEEILVSVGGAVLFDGDDFPASVGNGTHFVGGSTADLDTAINTAGDLNQIQALIQISGTQFGVKTNGIPMPKNIKLVNDGYKCPNPSTRSEYS